MVKITIKYNASVHTAAGWRGVEIEAVAEKISQKRAKVLSVKTIDGEKVVGTMSRTGAKRQSYYGIGVAHHEQGNVKNLSACEIIAE